MQAFQFDHEHHPGYQRHRLGHAFPAWCAWAYRFFTIPIILGGLSLFLLFSPKRRRSSAFSASICSVFFHSCLTSALSSSISFGISGS